MAGGNVQSMGSDMGTLDEPVTTTIMRDLTMVGTKMMCVLNPRKANIQTLKNWDLWGPLVLCLTLATLLSWFAPYDQKSLVFASVFVIICCGATVRSPSPYADAAWRGVSLMCLCLVDACLNSAGLSGTGGDGKCAASGWKYFFLPVGVRSRILHLPAQHCECHLFARRAHHLASDCGRGVLLLVNLGLARSVPHLVLRRARPRGSGTGTTLTNMPAPWQGSWGSLFRPTAGR